MPNQLFPDGMSPDEDFKYDIDSLGKSTAEVRGHLVDWFLKQDGDDHDYLALVNECGLDSESVEQLSGVISYLLQAMDADRISPEQVGLDLQAVGFEADVVANVVAVVRNLESVKGQVRFAIQKRIHEESGLPTIDNIDIVCDVRPVFADYPNTEPPYDRKHEELLGFSYISILQIQASGRAEGSLPQELTVQLNEADLADLIRSLTRAQEQIAVLKQRIPQAGAKP